MPVTYTITAGDVAGVDPDSLLTAGVVFDWTNQTITTPASIVGVNGQWVIDHARFAEDRLIGMTRPQIADGTGNVQIGLDPITGQPDVTGVFAILRDSWEIVTERTTGQEFTIVDVYKADSSLPYDNTVDAEVVYRQTVNPTVSTVISGSGLNATQATQLEEVHRIHGLESGTDLEITDTSRTAGTISQTISDSGGTTTVSRS